MFLVADMIDYFNIECILCQSVYCCLLGDNFLDDDSSTSCCLLMNNCMPFFYPEWIQHFNT